MAKKKKPKGKTSAVAPRPVPAVDADESRQAVAVTVAWMLLLLLTLAAEVIAIPAAIFATAWPSPADESFSLAQLGDLFLFVSLITGLGCLGLVPLTYRLRRTAPPRTITIAAVIAGILPWVTMAARLLF